MAVVTNPNMIRQTAQGTPSTPAAATSPAPAPPSNPLQPLPATIQNPSDKTPSLQRAVVAQVSGGTLNTAGNGRLNPTMCSVLLENRLPARAGFTMPAGCGTWQESGSTYLVNGAEVPWPGPYYNDPSTNIGGTWVLVDTNNMAVVQILQGASISFPSSAALLIATHVHTGGVDPNGNPMPQPVDLQNNTQNTIGTGQLPSASPVAPTIDRTYVPNDTDPHATVPTAYANLQGVLQDIDWRTWVTNVPQDQSVNRIAWAYRKTTDPVTTAEGQGGAYVVQTVSFNSSVLGYTSTNTPTVGNLVVAFFEGQNMTTTAPAGWTEIANEFEAGQGNTVAIWKIWTDTDSPTATLFESSGGVSAGCLVCFEIAGFNQTNPIDAFSTSSYAAGTGTPSVPASPVTPTQLHTLVLCGMGTYVWDPSITATPSSGWTVSGTATATGFDNNKNVSLAAGYYNSLTNDTTTAIGPSFTFDSALASTTFGTLCITIASEDPGGVSGGTVYPWTIYAETDIPGLPHPASLTEIEFSYGQVMQGVNYDFGCAYVNTGGVISGISPFASNYSASNLQIPNHYLINGVDFVPQVVPGIPDTTPSAPPVHVADATVTVDSTELFLTFTYATAPAEGNLILVAVAFDESQAGVQVNAPDTTWSYAETLTGDSSQPNYPAGLVVFQKTAGASEPTSYIFTLPTGNGEAATHLSGYSSEWNGVGSCIHQQGKVAASATQTSPTISTNQGNSVALHINAFNGFGWTSVTPTADWTLQTESAQSGNNILTVAKWNSVTPTTPVVVENVLTYNGVTSGNKDGGSVLVLLTTVLGSGALPPITNLPAENGITSNIEVAFQFINQPLDGSLSRVALWYRQSNTAEGFQSAGASGSGSVNGWSYYASVPAVGIGAPPAALPITGDYVFVFADLSNGVTYDFGMSAEDTQGGETQVVEITSTTDPTPVNPPGVNNGSVNLIVDSSFAAANYSGQKAEYDPNWFLYNNNGTDKYISKPGNPGEATTLGNYLAEEISASGQLFYGISLPIKVIPGTLYTLSAYIGSGSCGPNAGIALVIPDGTDQDGSPNIISGTKVTQAAATHSTISGTWTCPADGSIDEVAFLLSSFNNNIGTGGYQYMAKPMFQVGPLSAYVDGPASPPGKTTTSNLTVAPATANADTVAAAPTITSGAGAPTSTQPAGSSYLRTDPTTAQTTMYTNTNGTSAGWVPASTQNVEQLANVDDTTPPTDGQSLVYDAATGKWHPVSVGTGSITLEDITDVSTSGKTAGQVLTWNGTDWVADTPTTPASTLEELSDVSASTKSSGQVLTWNGTAWVPETPSSGGGGGGGATTLEELTDVSASSKSTGQVLTWNGTDWVPQTPSSGGGSGGSGGSNTNGLIGPIVRQTYQLAPIPATTGTTVSLLDTAEIGNMIITYGFMSGDTLTTPTGWTQLGNANEWFCFYRVADGSSSDTFTIQTAGGSSVTGTLQVSEFANAGAPYSFTTTSSGPYLYKTPLISTSTPTPSLVLVAFNNGVDGTPVFPPGWASSFLSGGDFGTARALGIATLLVPPGGSTSLTYFQDDGSSRYVAQFAIPAAASGPAGSAVTVDPTTLSLTTLLGGAVSGVVALESFTIPTNPGRFQFATVVKSNSTQSVGIAVDDGTNAYVIVCQTDGNGVCYRGGNTSYPSTLVGAPYGSGDFNPTVGAAHRIAMVIDVSTASGSTTTTIATYLDGALISVSPNAVLAGNEPLKISVLCTSASDVEAILYDDQNILPEGSISSASGTGTGGGGGGASTLEELTDVSASSKSAGQVLTWNGTDWVPLTPSSGGGGGGGGGTGVLPSSYDAMVQAESGLLYYWPLSDASGTPHDLVLDRGLTVTGTPTYHATSLLANGDPAMSFADNTVKLSFDTAMATRPNSPWTIEFFFEVPSTPTANVTLFNQESGGTTNFALVLLTSGELILDIPDVSDTNLLSVTPGTAYHIALIFDGVALYSWISGTLTYIGTFGFTANIGAAPALIAGGPLTMQKLAVYTLALSKARLNAHYEALAGSVWSWPFPAASGSSDSTINPSTLTLTTLPGGVSGVVPLPSFTIPNVPGRMQFAAVVASNSGSAVGVCIDDGSNVHSIVCQTDGNGVCYKGANTAYPGGTLVGAPYGAGTFNSNAGAYHRIAVIIDSSNVTASNRCTISTYLDGALITTTPGAIINASLALKISILCASASDVVAIYYDDQNILPEGSIGQGATSGGTGGSGSGDTELSELSDVSVSSPSNGQVLTYDSTTSKWTNETPSGGSGGGATTLEDLTDVSASSKSSGQVLTWNGTAWVPETPSSGGGGGGTVAYDSVITGQSPTNYWPLSDTAGSTTAADVVGSQPMTNGSTVTFGAPGLAQDGATSCFSAGLGGVLYIPSACQPTGNFSVSYLMAMAPNGPFANFAFGTTSAAFCIGAYSGGSGINFALLSQLVAWYQTVIPFNPGKVHIAVTNNGGNCSLYINGAEALNVGISITPQTVNGQILNAQGRMAKVGLWNGTVLTQAQILAQVAAAGL